MDRINGKNVFIRTVTHYYTGKVEEITPDLIVLSEAAWIADTGRWHACLAKGTIEEAEPFPEEVEPVLISRAGVIDVCLWPHALPRKVVSGKP